MPSSSLPIVERVITQEGLVRYAEASGDYNPLHLEPEFAAGTQFGAVIAHGMLTMAFISQMMTLAFGRDWLETGRLKVRFKVPAYLGDSVRTSGEVVKEESSDGRRRVECSVALTNDRGEELISGTATVMRTIAHE